jgi:hypothetical protein
MDEQWQSLMADNMKEIRSDIKELDNKLEKLTLDHTVHKVKSGFWGAIGGILIQLINIFK